MRVIRTRKTSSTGTFSRSLGYIQVIYSFMYLLHFWLKVGLSCYNDGETFKFKIVSNLASNIKQI